jgi:outer membrane protein
MAMYKKRVFAIIGILLIGGWFGQASAMDLKVAFVDLQKAVNECQAGKEAKKTMVKEAEKIQRLFGERQKELQTLKESIEKQAPMLTSEARAAKERDFQNKLRDYQRWLEDHQKELQQKGMEIERNIIIGFQKVIKKIGEDEGYTLILEKNENIVLFASKALDITDRVVKIYDTQKK